MADFKPYKVNSLPTSNIDVNGIYYVKTGANSFDTYIRNSANDDWIKQESGNVDLSDYDTSTEVDTKISTALDGVVGGFQGTIAIVDTKTADGYYTPTEAGTYANAGGLVYAPATTDEGYFVMFIFDGTTWTKKKILINSLTLTQSINPTDVTWIANRFVVADSTKTDYGGIRSATSSYIASGFVELPEEFDQITFSRPISSSNTMRDYGLVWYDESQIPISNFHYPLGTTTGTVRDIISIPEMAKFVRLTTWAGSKANFKLLKTATYEDVLLYLISEHNALPFILTNRENELIEHYDMPPRELTMYEYSGNQIKIEHKVGVETYMTGLRAGLSGSASSQGGAVYEEYLFVGSSKGKYIDVYNLETKLRINEISIVGATETTDNHMNTMFFSNQYHTVGDQFPILYSCSGYAVDIGAGIMGNYVYGFRVLLSGGVFTAELVHTITLKNIGWSDAVYDNHNMTMWVKVSETIDTVRYAKFMKYKIPLYSAGDATIDLLTDTPLKEFSIIQFPFGKSSWQGLLYDNNMIYVSTGTGSEAGGERLMVINTLNEQTETTINLRDLGLTGETEYSFIYKSKLYVGYRNKIIKFYFQ